MGLIGLSKGRYEVGRETCWENGGDGGQKWGEHYYISIFMRFTRKIVIKNGIGKKKINYRDT